MEERNERDPRLLHAVGFFSLDTTPVHTVDILSNTAVDTITKACVENADCKKGLMCTARCLGDSACITGCFARFGNEVLNDLLQCSIEDYKCINIAIITPGAQPPDEVPLPPKALATTFKPSSMEVPPSPTQTPTLQQKK